MIHSESFGRAFWLDDDNEVCSAPWRKNGTVDTAQMDYLADWSDMEGVDMSRLMEVIRRLGRFIWSAWHTRGYKSRAWKEITSSKGKTTKGGVVVWQIN